jgi:hypothetical protein
MSMNESVLRRWRGSIKWVYPNRLAPTNDNNKYLSQSPFQSLIPLIDILLTFLQNAFIMVLYRTLLLILTRNSNGIGYVEPSANGRKAMLAPAYALPMVNGGVVAIICVWSSQQWPGIRFVGHREVGRTAQRLETRDSRFETREGVEKFEVGKRRDARRVVRRIASPEKTGTNL